MIKNKISAVGILIFSVATLVNAAQTPEATIRLYPAVSQQDDAVTLNQVGIINAEGLTPADLADLGNIALSNAQENLTTLTKQDIREKINKEFIKPVRILLLGPEVVEVRRYKASFSADEFYQSAESCLQKALDSNYEKVEISRISSLNSLQFTDSNIKIDCEWVEKLPPNKKENVLIKLTHNGDIIKKMFVWFSVKVNKTVYVLEQNVHQNQDMATAVLKPVNRDIAGLKDQPIFDFDLNKQKIFNSNQSAGVIVTADMLRDMPDVVEGESVKIISTHGVIHIEAEAIAMRNAYVGEQTEVKALETGKQLKGTVVAQGVVVMGGSL